MVRAFDWQLADDLYAFSLLLSQKGVAHRLTEESGRQVLWVQPQHLAWVRALFADWQKGAVQPAAVSNAQQVPSQGQGILADWKRIPCTLLLLAACGMVAALTALGTNLEQVAWFSPRALFIRNEQVFLAPFSWSLSHGEYWRLVTPMFLHFGVFHLLFNMLWLLQLGHRLEIRYRGWVLPCLVLLTGVLSNLTQLIWSAPSTLFGGMSGVIYGLFGFCWQTERRWPAADRLPIGLYIFMLLWLAVGFTPLPAALGLGQMANGAHLGGGLAGLAAAWLYAGRSVARK